MAADVDALNYPYVRIRSAEWLKRTLLVFPHVVRIVPEWGVPEDQPEIAQFCQLRGRRGPLLRSASLKTRGVRRAQEHLIANLESRLDSDPDFVANYGKGGRRARPNIPIENSVWGSREREWWRQAEDKYFQLGRSKMSFHLIDFLTENGLAWEPRDPHSVGYIEVNWRLGQAIMATLAHACAADEGLELVTEFPDVFNETIDCSVDQILDANLSGNGTSEKPAYQEMAQFVVYNHCNVDKLTPERLQALNEEWEALAAFKDALESAANALPEIMADGKIRRERLHQLSNHIIHKWSEDKANLSNFARKLFGDGFSDAPEKFLEKLGDAVFHTEGHLGLVSGGAVGGVDGHILLGAGAGLALGVIVHVGKAYAKDRRAQQESPWRYLTLMEQNGVGFVLAR